MTTEKASLANRLNALRSTGPRTAAGKAAVARNALKHGLLARAAVMEGEDPRALAELEAEMLEELAPVGAVERMLADQVIAGYWRQRRMVRIERELMEAHLARDVAAGAGGTPAAGAAGVPPAFSGAGEPPTLGAAFDRNLAGHDSYSRLRRYAGQIERELHRSLRELEARQAVRRAAAELEIRESGGRVTLPVSMVNHPLVYEAIAAAAGVADHLRDRPEEGEVAEQSHFDRPDAARAEEDEITEQSHFGRPDARPRQPDAARAGEDEMTKQSHFDRQGAAGRDGRAEVPR